MFSSFVVSLLEKGSTHLQQLSVYVDGVLIDLHDLIALQVSGNACMIFDWMHNGTMPIGI